MLVNQVQQFIDNDDFINQGIVANFFIIVIIMMKSTKTACFGIKVMYTIYKDLLRVLRY